MAGHQLSLGSARSQRVGCRIRETRFKRDGREGGSHSRLSSSRGGVAREVRLLFRGAGHAGKRCQIGPNAYLRAYSSLGDDVKVGAGCEIKNSIVMKNTKIPHLSYVGDSILGEGCSLGAGTITANLRFDEAEIKSKLRGSWVNSGRKKLG